METKKAYLTVLFAVLTGLLIIFYSKPCIADPPEINCTVEPSAVERGQALVVKVESEEPLKSLKVFLKQPKISSAPLVVQNMIGRKYMEIAMKKGEGNSYVGHIDTADLRPGEAFIMTYATSMDKEHAGKSLTVNIK